MSKTPKTSPNTVTTLRTHYQSATKTPTTTETQLTIPPRHQQDRHHQFPKGLVKGFSQKVVVSILCHSHHHHHNTITTPSQQHHNHPPHHHHHHHYHHHHHHHHHHCINCIFILHQPCPYHLHHHHQ